MPTMRYSQLRKVFLTISCHGVVMEESKDLDWHRLAEMIKKRRAILGVSQNDLQHRGGPSSAVQSSLEKGDRDNYRESVLSGLEKSLGWEAGSVEEILIGNEPILTTDETDDLASAVSSLADAVNRLAERITPNQPPL